MISQIYPTSLKDLIVIPFLKLKIRAIFLTLQCNTEKFIA